MLQQHLEQCFYITKPVRQPVNLDDCMERIQTQVEIVQAGDEEIKIVENRLTSNTRHSYEFDRIFNMINQKRAPSASIKTRLKSKKNTCTSQEQISKCLSGFQQFFEGFVYPEQKQNIRRTKKKHTTKHFYLGNQTTDTEIEGDSQKNKFEEEALEEKQIRKLEKKLTYHRRMKQKITQRIQGIVAQNQQKKLRKIQMLDRDNELSVDKVLWMKGQTSKPAPKMQIIRSGLPVRLREVDAKVKTAGRTHLEDQKAKKDRAFYKVLQKNCQVVMADIDLYLQKQQKSKSKTNKRPSTSKMRPTYLKQTCSALMKKGSLVDKVRKSMDDGEFSRWRGKCVELQQSIDHSRQNSRKISKGLKVFAGYCRYIDGKLTSDQNNLASMMKNGSTKQVGGELYNF